MRGHFAPLLLSTTLCVIAGWGTGCAHRTRTSEPAPQAKRKGPVPRPALPRVYRPESQEEARLVLGRAFQAAGDEDYGRAAALFNAVLATDFLTDKGRADIYWVSAESFRRLQHPPGQAAALEGFLLTAALLPRSPDDHAHDDLELRLLLARSLLMAMRVLDDPDFGRSPRAAISVEDVREPASIIASLSCGPRGEGRYVDVAIDAVQHAHATLLHRRAKCQQSGVVLELWFDVTHAELPSPPKPSRGPELAGRAEALP